MGSPVTLLTTGNEGDLILILDNACSKSRIAPFINGL
jgi:hypothetical protein